MEKILSGLCEWLIKNGYIWENEKEVYEYCFAVLFMNVMYYLICILVMWHYKIFLQPILFTVVFLLTRSHMGGWHAQNMWNCLLLGLLLFTVAVNLMIYPDIAEQEKILFSGISMFLTIGIVFFFGIQDHPNRRLSKTEKITAKKKCIAFLFGLIAVVVIVLILRWEEIAFSIALACFSSTLLFLLAKLKERGTKDYEKN